MINKFSIPYGVWSMNGDWYPNPALNMSADEQYEHNLRNGYTMKRAAPLSEPMTATEVKRRTDEFHKNVKLEQPTAMGNWVSKIYDSLMKLVDEKIEIEKAMINASIYGTGIMVDGKSIELKDCYNYMERVMKNYKPEIGVECLGKFQEPINNQFMWQKCTPIHQERNEWAVKAANGGRLSWCDEFKAIESPEDMARKADVLNLQNIIYSTGNCLKAANCIYDDGYRKQLEEVSPEELQLFYCGLVVSEHSLEKRMEAMLSEYSITARVEGSGIPIKKEVEARDFAYMVGKMFNAYPPAIDQLIGKIQREFTITEKVKS